MSEARRFSTGDLVLFLLILASAAGARAWYLSVCANGGLTEEPLQVQDPSPLLTGLPPNTEMHGHTPPTEMDALIHNLKESNWFGRLAPLANVEEQTAHVSPGYPWLVALLERSPLDVGPIDRTIRWIQCGLGALTALI